MLTGHFPGEMIRPEQVKLSGVTERRLMRVIRKCLHTEKSRRYQSALDLEQELQKLWDQSDCTAYRYGARRMEESLVITVAGSRHGVGTTHIAMGLTAYLQKCGMSVVYEELNESGAVRQLAESRKSQADIYGIFHIRNIPMLPRYGEAVKLMPARISDKDPGLRSGSGSGAAGGCRRLSACVRRQTMGVGRLRDGSAAWQIGTGTDCDL